VGASAALSFTAQLLHEAQRQGEPVAWVQGRDSLFHPPDLAATGVDLRRAAHPAAPDTRRRWARSSGTCCAAAPSG
jgi:hypothetical protein